MENRGKLFRFGGDMSLCSLFRPESFDEVYGNKWTVESLKSILKSGNKPHAFLFIGDSGCGKTTLARIVAKELGCSGSDLIEINASNTRGIDTARQISENSNFPPMVSNTRVYILDESHQLTAPAQEALLKVVEESPNYLYFMFCTTNPDRLIKTLRNRCIHFKVEKLSNDDMDSLIRDVYFTVKEKECDSEVVKLIRNSSDRCPRTALTILEKIINLDNIDDMKEVVSKLDFYGKSNSLQIAKTLSSLNMDAMTRFKRSIELLEKCDDDIDNIVATIVGYISHKLEKENNLDNAIVLSDMIGLFGNLHYINKKAFLKKSFFDACFIGK